jgi:hypothetical protein
MLSSLSSTSSAVSFSSRRPWPESVPASELLRYNFSPTTATTISNIFTGQSTYTATLMGGITTTTAHKPPKGNDNTHSLFCSQSVVNSALFLEIPQITLANKNIFSVCYWIKKIADTPSTGDSVIWELDMNGGSTLYQNRSTKAFFVKAGTSNSFTLNTNWNHIVVCYNYTTSTYMLYLNGTIHIANGTGLNDGWISTPNSNTFGKSRIGRSISSAHHSFNGYIGDFRIYNGTLTQSQVFDIYNGGNI